MELINHSLFNDANLVAYYRFEGNANDSKSSNNGTDTNITYGSSYGKFGQGALFNGSSSYINLSSVPITGSGNFSVCAWIKTSNTGARKEIISFGGSNTNLGFFLFINATNKAEINLYNTNGPISTTTLTDGNWHFVTSIYNSGTFSIYIDSIFEASQNSFSPNITDGLREIGRAYYNSLSHFNGNIDDISIFSKALTSTEIANLYTSTFHTLNVIETSTLSEVFSKIRNKFRIYNETSTLSEIFRKIVNKFFNESSTLSEIFSHLKHIFQSFTDVETSSDPDIDIIKAKGLEFNDNSILSDFISRSWSSTKNFIDNITSSDLILKSRGFFHTLTDTHTLTDWFIKYQVLNRVLTDSMSLIDSIKKYLNGFPISRWIKQAKATLTFSKVAKPSTTWTKTEKPDDL